MNPSPQVGAGSDARRCGPDCRYPIDRAPGVGWLLGGDGLGHELRLVDRQPYLVGLGLAAAERAHLGDAEREQRTAGHLATARADWVELSTQVGRYWLSQRLANQVLGWKLPNGTSEASFRPWTLGLAISEYGVE